MVKVIIKTEDRNSCDAILILRWAIIGPCVYYGVLSVIMLNINTGQSVATEAFIC